MAEYNFDRLKQDFEAAPQSSELLKLYARNMQPNGALRDNDFGKGFAQLPEGLRASVAKSYGDAKAAVAGITADTAALLARRDFNAQDLVKLQERIEAYKGPPIYVEGTYTSIPAASSAVRLMNEALRAKAEAAAKAIPAHKALDAGGPTTIVSGDLPAAGQAKQAPRSDRSPAQDAALTEFRAAMDTQDWTKIGAAAENYKAAFKDYPFKPKTSPTNEQVDKVFKGLEDQSQGRVNDLKFLSGPDGIYTLEEMGNISRYADIAITKEKARTELKAAEAKAYEAQLKRGGDFSASAVMPVQGITIADMADPAKRLTALFNKSCDPEILKAGFRVSSQIEHSVSFLKFIEIGAGSHDRDQALDAGLLLSQMGMGLNGLNNTVIRAQKLDDMSYRDPVTYRARPYYEMALKLLDDKTKVPKIPDVYRDNPLGYAKDLMDRKITAEYLTPEEKKAMARDLLEASAEMGYLPAMGRLGSMIHDTDPARARGFVAAMKGALQDNFVNAATQGTAHYMREFADELSLLNEKLTIADIKPAQDAGLGITPIEQVRGALATMPAVGGR